MKNHKPEASQGAPASQGKKIRLRQRGNLTLTEGAASRASSRLPLIASVLPAVVVLALSVLGYIQSRPNTAGVASQGPFDGQRAFADLRRLVAFGPRPSGSVALERTREFIMAELRAASVSFSEDKFTAATPMGPISMTNIVAEIPGASPSIVIIGGHYDTKRMATHFVGANDGGSSAAFVLELARVLAKRHNKVIYWLVFFDGEEAIRRWSATDSLYGSRHFAAELTTQETKSRVEAVIVVDMIADAHLGIHRETHSTPWLNDLVFTQARQLGYHQYFLSSSKTVDDDHQPFVELGIPAIDLIDLNYGPLNLYWHTRFDTVEKCSPRSLQVVGTVVLRALSVLPSVLDTCIGTPVRKLDPQLRDSQSLAPVGPVCGLR